MILLLQEIEKTTTDVADHIEAEDTVIIVTPRVCAVIHAYYLCCQAQTQHRSVQFSNLVLAHKGNVNRT